MEEPRKKAKTESDAALAESFAETVKGEKKDKKSKKEKHRESLAEAVSRCMPLSYNALPLMIADNVGIP